MIDALLSRLIVLLMLSRPLSAYVSSVPYLTNSSEPTNKTSSNKALDPPNESPSASSSGVDQTTTLDIASSRPVSSTERDIAGGISLSSSLSSTLSTVNAGSPSPAKASSALVSDLNSTSTSILFGNEHVGTTGTSHLYHTSAQLSPNSSLSPTGFANVTGFVGNSSVDVEACFTQWSSFWSLSAQDYTTFQSAIGGTTWFSSHVTSTTTYAAVYPTTSTSRGVDSETETEYAGAYPTATITTTWTYAYTYTYSSYVPGSTLTTTYEKSSEHGPSSYTTVTIGSSLTAPACQLPSVVPQCQSQWASYESLKLTDTSYNLGGMSTPLCPQASIGTALCTDLRDLYITQWINDYAENGYVAPYIWSGAGSVGTAITEPDGSVLWTSTFPTGSSLAPGCTLGCARCAITGGKVRLLYWPVPQTSFLNLTASTAMTTAGNAASGPVLAPFSGTTLTSPTVYISYANLYASDSCSAIGANHSATIIPIPESADLSSLYYPPFGTVSHVPQTEFFNFTDLNSPVPGSIYTRQPKCYGAGSCSGSSGPYEPILVVPTSILQSIDPTWSTCSGDFRGLYDPPYALHGAAQAAVPESSDPWPSTTAASPPPAPQTVTPKPSPTPPGASATSAILPSLLPSSLPVGNDPSSKDPSANQASPSNGDPSHSEDPGPSTNPSSGSSSSPDGGAPGKFPSSGDDHDADQGSPSGNNPSSNSDSPSGSVSSGGSDPSGNDPGTGDSGSTDPQRQGSDSASVPSTSSGHGSPNPAVDPIYSLASPQGGSIADGKGGSGIAAAIMSGIGGQPVDPTNDGSTGGNAGTEPSGDTSSASGSGTSSGIGGNDPEDPHQISGGNSGGGTGSSESSSGSNTGQVNAGNGDPQDPSGAGDGGSEGQEGSSPDYPTSSGSHAGSGNPSSAGIGGGSLGAGNSVIQILTAQEADTPLARFTVDGSTFTAQSGQPVILGSTTLNAGGSAATVGNQVVSVGDSGIVVGTQAIPYSSGTAPAAAIFTAGGRTYSAQAGKPLIVNGVTLSPGGDAATVDGQMISLGSFNVIVGTRTLPFENTAALTASGAVVTVDSSSLTAIDQGGHVAVGSETLSIGGAAATIAGETVSVASSGIVIDGTTHTFSHLPAAATSSNEFEASFSISGTPYTAFESPGHPRTAVILAANGIPTTISVGGSAATIDGQAVSLNSDGVIVGTSSISFSSATMTGTLEQEATFSDPAGHIHTAWEDIGGGNSAVLDGSVTLEVGGPAATVDGEMVSLATGGLIINETNTVAFAVATGPSGSGTTSGSAGGSETQRPSATGTQDPNVSSADRTSTADLAMWILGLETAVVLLAVTFGT